MGRANRMKGKRWERQIARDMREIFGGDVRRGWQSREGDDEADNEGVPRFWVEAKHEKRPSLRAALRQATKATDGRWPLVIAKFDTVRDPGDARKPLILVVLWAGHFDSLTSIIAAALNACAKGGTSSGPVSAPAVSGVGGKQPDIVKAYLALAAEEQFKAEALDLFPVVSVTDDGASPFAVMSYNDFKHLCERWFGTILKHVEKALRS